MVRLHSTVDLITNSSTTIYSSATKDTVKEVQNFVNAVLKAAGVPQRCSDLFNLELVPDYNMLEQEADNLMYELKDDPTHELHSYLTPDEISLIVEDVYIKGRLKVIVELLKKAMVAGYTLQHCDSENETQSIDVTDKQGNPVDVAGLLNSIRTWENYE